MRFVVGGVLLAPAIAYAQLPPLPPLPPVRQPVDPWAPDPAPEPVAPDPPSTPVRHEPIKHDHLPSPPPPEPLTPAEPEPEPDPDPDPVEPPFELPIATLATSPTEPEPEPLRYPLLLPARPLILPDGTATFGMGIDLGHVGVPRGPFGEPGLSVITGGTSFHAGISIGHTELALGASFNAFDSQDSQDSGRMATVPTVRRLSAALHRLVAPALTVGTLIVLGNVDSELQRFSPNLSLTKKVHLSNHAAFYVNVGIDYESAATRDQVGNLVDTSHMSMFSTLAVEAGFAERVSLHAGTTIQLIELLENPGVAYSGYREYSTRLAMVIAASDSVDVSIAWNVYSSWATDARAVSVGLDLRRFR